MSKCEGNGSFFWHQVIEMNEKLSLKMGMKFAVSLPMGEKFLDILYKNSLFPKVLGLNCESN